LNTNKLNRTEKRNPKSTTFRKTRNKPQKAAGKSVEFMDLTERKGNSGSLHAKMMRIKFFDSPLSSPGG